MTDTYTQEQIVRKLRKSMIVSELPPMEITAEDRANAKTDMHALAVNRRSLLSFCTFLATRERQLTAALAKVRELEQEVATTRTYSHETVRALVDHRDARIARLEQELATLRTAAEGMEKALERYFNTLSDDCGDHCTNNCRECQARAALAAYREAVGR